MLTNFHTPEEVVLSAIEKGFAAIGFSGHGYTPFDLGYCVKDLDGYMAEINRLKEKYSKKIQIYLGIEEDAFAQADRAKYDYIIGSSHYFYVRDRYYPIDTGYDQFQKCLEVFDYHVPALAEAYYSSFCDYILKRRPDIIGHFDLITKYDEVEESLFLHNDAYYKIAEKYIAEAAKSQCIFEVNTGAISRGLRSGAYPEARLLYVLKKLDAKLILSSDSHQKDTIDCSFGEVTKQLKDIGFTHLYTLYDGAFVKYEI